jgi:hypothetical protein
MTLFFSGTLCSRADVVYEGERTQSIQEFVGASGTGMYAVGVCLFQFLLACFMLQVVQVLLACNM